MSLSSDSESPLTVDTPSENFQLSDRFKDVHASSFGSSGLVLSAYDTKLEKKVAVKRILLANQSRRALREVKFIRKLKHSNIVQILDILDPACKSVYADESKWCELSCLQLVEESLNTDLHSLIQGRHLNENHARWFVYQILRGVHYIHSANLIHRDLKPANLLVNTISLQLKITDFGSCRVIDPSYDHRGYLTERVGSCWYRSPEQILTPADYSGSVDLWSVGCVLAEMLLGRPLFAGANELNQMMLFLDTVHLEEDDWGEVLHVMPNKLLKNHPFRPRRPLTEQFTDIDSDALDLLEQLLRFNAGQRWSAERALSHGYLAEYGCGQEEPTASICYHVEHEVEEEPPMTSTEESSTDASTEVSSVFSSDRGHSTDSYSTGDISRSQVSRRAHNTIPMLVLDEMHTLDEILHLSDEETSMSTLGGSSDDCSSKSASVEDLNLRNLRNSQENLCKTPSFQNILSLSDDECFQSRQNEGNHTTTTHINTEDDEKDVPEISVEKRAEDEQLEKSVRSADGQFKEVDVPVSEEGDCYRTAFAVDCYKELRVNLQVTENYKEYSQVSPKETDGKNDGDSEGNHQSSTKPKVSVRHKHYSGENTEDSLKEKKLLEFYNKNMFESENKETNKIRRKRSARNNRSSHNVDMDEMYRLPTEHLCVDRDYSNERIRHRNLVKMQRQCLARYRDEINEINERLKEASIDGAVGGVDIPEEQHQDTPSGIATQDPAPRGLEMEYLNQSMLGDRQRRTQLDTGFSSPEELPSSPRASFSAGARPKKSPRKQKAL